MTRWLPYPLLSVLLLAMWLLLNQTLAVGHIILGGILALCGPLALAVLQAPKGGARRPVALARLVFLVLIDIVRSNIAVARIILHPSMRGQTSGFVSIPLDLRNPNGLAVLACIITSTPGTLWVDLDAARGVLVIHVLDLIDENTWIETIKRRYERLLLEIFE